MAGEVLGTVGTVHLDWSDPAHWAPTAKDCRCCGTPTRTRDWYGRPCHQSCAEAELARERAGAAGGGSR